jgi:hypothetical protein
VALLTIEEIQAIPHFLDGDGVLLSTVFEDKLFEEQKGTFMLDFLSNLDEGFPSIFGGDSCAIWTLCVLDEELDLKDLFKDRGSQDLVNNT